MQFLGLFRFGFWVHLLDVSVFDIHLFGHFNFVYYLLPSLLVGNVQGQGLLNVFSCSDAHELILIQVAQGFDGVVVLQQALQQVLAAILANRVV